MFTFIYYNSFPTSPLSVAKETTAVEKCVRQPSDLREAPHISTFISLLIHLIVDVKKYVPHFFVSTHPLYMRPLACPHKRMLEAFEAKLQNVLTETRAKNTSAGILKTKVSFRCCCRVCFFSSHLRVKED